MFFNPSVRNVRNCEDFVYHLKQHEAYSAIGSYFRVLLEQRRQCRRRLRESLHLRWFFEQGLGRLFQPHGTLGMFYDNFYLLSQNTKIKETNLTEKETRKETNGNIQAET